MSLCLAQILWENRFMNDVGNVCKISVDGTDFQIYEPKPFWKGWHSHKFRGPGLRYEVGLCLRTGFIVWISGPFPCGAWPDLKIFREDLIHYLEEGEMVEADAGYRGEPARVKLPSDDDDGMGAVARARHETVNKRLKQWGCLHRVFRHRKVKHQVVFTAVAVITQQALENGEPLFGFDYVHDM